MARRNGNGEGSRPRERADGRWEARYWSQARGGAFACEGAPDTWCALLRSQSRCLLAVDRAQRLQGGQPAPRVPPPEIQPLSSEEAKRYLVAAQGDRFEALYVLGLTSGMRLGELGGSFWSDTDLTRRVLHVQRALITGHGGQTLEPPKTPESRRSIGLTIKAVDALLHHRKRQRAEGFSVEGDALVFTNRAGNPINPRIYSPARSRPYSNVRACRILYFMLQLVIPAASCWHKGSTREP